MSINLYSFSSCLIITQCCHEYMIESTDWHGALLLARRIVVSIARC